MKVSFGIKLPTWAGFSYEEIMEQTILAEKNGFDYICVDDHLFESERQYRMFKVTYEKCDPTRMDHFDVWMILAAVAATTKRVKLGPGVTPIPYYNPARLAKIVVTLDHMSNGRVIFGAGLGWHQEEAKCYNIPWESLTTRYRMMNEGIELMKKLWTTDARVTWKGRYYKVDNAPAWPKPLQKPHPPIWFGGSGEKIIEATGRSGDGWCPFIISYFTPQVYKEKWNKVKEWAKKTGRDPEKIVPSAHLMISMERDYDRARDKYVGAIKTLLGRDLDENDLRFGIFGTPDDCIDKLEDYFDAGVRYFVLNPEIHPNNVKKFFETFSKKIIPHFDKLS